MGLTSLHALKLAELILVYSSHLSNLLNALSPNLRHLSLETSHQGLWGDESLTCLADHCPLLTHLTLEGCFEVSDMGISALAERCTGLLELYMMDCQDASTQSWEALADNRPDLTNLMFQTFPGIGDDALVYLAERCRKLRTLRVISALVTDIGVAGLARCCPDMRSLSLAWCAVITGTSLAALGRHCHALEALDVSFCRSIEGSGGFAELAQGCPLLRDVNLGSCLKIEDESVFALVRHCRHLHTLKIAGCKLTDAVIATVRDECPTLRVCGIGGRFVDFVAPLRQARPEMTVVYC
jgi:F-box/leucine-rich repeat protein 2/20